MRVLIIGCEFAKNNFINYLFENNDDCFILNLENKQIENLCQDITFLNRYQKVKGSLLSSDLLCYILNQYSIDTVIHFATYLNYNKDKDSVIEIQTLFEACKKYGKVEKFIYISNNESEKISAEFILPIIVINTNVFELNPYTENIISKFIEQLNNNEKLTIKKDEDSSNLISFLDIHDFCNGINVVMNKGKIGEIYDLCNYEKYSILDVAKILIKHLKHTDEYLNWIIHDCNEYYSYKPQYNCDNNQRLKDLGWEIKTSFELKLFGLLKPFYKNIPDNFDLYAYKNLNIELSHLSHFDCVYHYETIGYTQDRIFSSDFTYKIFVYCCGKSGSSTLLKTFKEKRFQTLQIHNMDYYSKRLCQSKYEPDVFNLNK